MCTGHWNHTKLAGKPYGKTKGSKSPSKRCGDRPQGHKGHINLRGDRLCFLGGILVRCRSSLRSQDSNGCKFQQHVLSRDYRDIIRRFDRFALDALVSAGPLRVISTQPVRCNRWVCFGKIWRQLRGAGGGALRHTVLDRGGSRTQRLFGGNPLRFGPSDETSPTEADQIASETNHPVQ